MTFLFAVPVCFRLGLWQPWRTNLESEFENHLKQWGNLGFATMRNYMVIVPGAS
jgi:hypothetical protein